MFWFLLILLTLESAAHSINQEIDQKEEVFNYLYKLLRSVDKKYPETNDVTVLKISSNQKQSQKIEDVFEIVIHSIPDSMPFLLPPVEELIEFRNLRPA